MDGIRNIIRQSKTLIGPFPEFNINETSDNPHELFLEWFQVAIDNGVYEPHSMILSTTDHNGFPDARVLIMKDIDQNGWYFASSSQSEKGRQIEVNPNVALTFYWSLIGRQVRIRGKVVKMEKDISAKDFLNRGTIARAIALVNKQSSILKEQREFEEAIAKQIYLIQQNPTLVSPSWTLYRVVAKEVEFWQAEINRKHIRLRYTLEGDKWLKDILWA
jgi:pyridoxamine 5'-phosphate oxidase